MNIRRAVFNCLDDGIDDAFKVSNNPALTGWNALMEPREMFDQITATYGRPTPAALLQNDTFFRSVYSPQDAPEMLFRRIEDCQEVQILGEDPYTAQQLLNNAVAYSYKPASTPVTSRIGTARLQPIKYGQTSKRSSKKPTHVV
jgi:hypothetical protein